MAEISELKTHECWVYDYGCRADMVNKSEADKVIAEKDKEIQRLENLCESYRIDCDNLAIREANAYKEIGRDNNQIRHQKYKRGLAMVKECEAIALWCYQAANTLPTGFHATLFGKPVMIEPDRLFNRFELLMKWSNRWMKLAKQFKESK